MKEEIKGDSFVDGRVGARNKVYVWLYAEIILPLGVYMPTNGCGTEGPG